MDLLSTYRLHLLTTAPGLCFSVFEKKNLRHRKTKGTFQGESISLDICQQVQLLHIFLPQFANCVDSAQFVTMKEFVRIGGLLEEESGSWCLLGIKLNT